MNGLLLAAALALSGHAQRSVKPVAPTRLAELTSVLSPVMTGMVPQPSVPGRRVEMTQAQLTALFEQARALAPQASVAPQPERLPARLLLDRAASELGGLTPEALRSMSPEKLEVLAGKILDGAKAAAAAEAVVPKLSVAAAAKADQTAALVDVLGDPTMTHRLLRGLVGSWYADGVDPLRFSSLARRVYIESSRSPEALSLVELRRQAESELAKAATRWPEAARKLAGRRGAGRLGELAAAAADALKSSPSLADMDEDPALAVGRDAALLEAVSDFETALGGRASGALSKAARRDVVRMRREARALRERLVELKALTDLGFVTAEGMVRTRFFRADDAKLPPVAEVAVVGGGPAGLATAIHAAHAGAKPVLLEGGYIAQSFSDLAMKPVYRMRTPTTRNSLVQAPFSPLPLVQELAMPRWLRVYRGRGQAADDALIEESGRAFQGGERAGLAAFDPSIPSARNELLQHYAHVAEEIERRGGTVAEGARVVSATKNAAGLWELALSDGRVQLARKVVLAQGQVGTELQNGKFPDDLDRAARLMGHLTLRSRHELSAKNAPLAMIDEAEAKGELSGRQLFVHDSLLGAPEIERSIQRLKPGSRAVVMGSGESAAKAVLTILRLNPSAKVTLLVKEPLVEGQVQLPAHLIQAPAIEEALTSREAADRSMEEWKRFGTPVTPATVADIAKAEADGRVRVLSLGYKPTFYIVRETPRSRDTAVRMSRVGHQTKLERNGRELERFDGPMIVAVGYDRAKLRRDPLTQSLIDRGYLRVSGKAGHKLSENELALADDGSCAGDRSLFVVGAQNFGCAQDSAIPGMVARAAKIGAKVAAPRPAPKRGGSSTAKPAPWWSRWLTRLRP